MNLQEQLVFNTRLRIRMNSKVDTTVPDINKQGNVQDMEFDIPRYDNLVWDVSLISDRIDSNTEHGLYGNL